ncbi:MAG: AEC family transporter [Candidatus Binataceae bacterium]
MLNVFLTLAVIAFVGSILHRMLPDLDVDLTRKQCGALVLNVLLPALNIEVIYGSPLGNALWRVPLTMLIGLVVCVASAVLVFRLFTATPNQKCSLIIGSAFGNVTYLGMPLLQGLFPNQFLHVTEIAVLCEITVTSSDLIAGTLLSMFKNGGKASLSAAFAQIMRFPLILSAIAAAIIKIVGFRLPEFLLSTFHLLGQCTSGLMLLILGMALKTEVLKRAFADFRTWWPALVIKLGFSPLVVALAGATVGLSHPNMRSTIIEAAMPPQLFTFIVADRFGFDIEILATAVAFMTVLSMLTVPIITRMLAHL